MILAAGMREVRSRRRTGRLVFAAIVLVATLAAISRDIDFMSRHYVLDLSIYRCYARSFWLGDTVAPDLEMAICATLWTGPPHRFRTLPIEYPAPALAVFSLPLLTPGLSYVTAFALWMALCILLVTGTLGWRGPPESALAFPLYTLLAGWFLVMQRYDLLPGLCVLIALILAKRGRARGATVALAAGTLLKVFPIVLLPLLLIACKRAERGRWRADLVALFAAVCVAGALPAMALNSGGFWEPLHYQLNRPLQLESLGGSMFWISSVAGLGPAPGTIGGPSIDHSHLTLNVAGAASTTWGDLCLAMGAAGMLLAYWRAWRGKDSLARSFVLVLVLLLIGNRVFSPQYVLWVLPAVAVAEGLRLRWLLVAGLTCFVIRDYYDVWSLDLPWNHQFLAALLARNLLLIAIAGLYLSTPDDLGGQRWPSTALWRSLAVGLPARWHVRAAATRPGTHAGSDS